MITELIAYEDSQEERLIREVEELRESLDKQRRAQFARLSHISKKYDELYNEFQTLKQAICRGQNA